MASERVERVLSDISDAEKAEVMAAGLTLRGDGMVMKDDRPMGAGSWVAALKIARKVA